MNGINKVILIGHLGKDPELRNFEGGNVTAKFSLATTETYKDKTGNKVDSTEWHNVVMWSRLAEIAGKYLRKGSLIYVEGKLKTRSWDDKEGQKKYTTEVVADIMTMLDKKSSGDNNDSDSGSASAPANSNAAEADDDLPF